MALKDLRIGHTRVCADEGVFSCDRLTSDSASQLARALGLQVGGV
jgi:hypothetical protein